MSVTETGPTKTGSSQAAVQLKVQPLPMRQPAVALSPGASVPPPAGKAQVSSRLEVKRIDMVAGRGARVSTYGLATAVPSGARSRAILGGAPAPAVARSASSVAPALQLRRSA